jgi:N-acetyl-anhydromuramyl-L-alanine amidase AmpD
MSDHFFEQLQKFSERVFDALGFEEKVSPWQGSEFKGGHPIGATLHFTAGSDIRRALRWFMQKKHEAQASANVVVADGWPEEWIELAENLDLVKALPAAVVQCVPPDKPAWHATWVNSMCYGIEMVNAGELRLHNGEWAWWPDDYTRTWHAQGAVPKEPVQMYGRAWEPYTVEQVLAVVEVLRQVQKLYGTLTRYMTVGHENVTRAKIDPGPLFPIHGVRLAMYEPDINPEVYQWLQKFRADPQRDGEQWRDDLVVEWCTEISGYPVGPAEAWLMFDQAMHGQFRKPTRGFGILGKTAMQLLGYYMGSPGSDLDLNEKRSVEVFQKMMGLRVDGDPGVQTKSALVVRLEECGFLSKQHPGPPGG